MSVYKIWDDSYKGVDMVGKLEIVPVREIWEHEAYDFSSWMFDNFDVLNEQIGLSISPIEKEKSVGPFNVDILAEDSEGRTVIIENQLNKTDHDHLGKVLTYMSNLDAKIAIWVSTNPRPEHITAIEFLNEVVPSDTHFYLLKLQAFKIGDSDPAPLFTVESGPSEERTAGGTVKKELADRDHVRYKFFEKLLEKANQSSKLFGSVNPVGYQNWVSAGAGKAGLMWLFVSMKKTSRVEFFLCHPDSTVNKTRFEMLASHKDEIEKEFGEPLCWEFSDSRKQQYIRSHCPHGGIDDEEKWPEIQRDMVARVIRLEKAIRPYMESLR